MKKLFSRLARLVGFARTPPKTWRERHLRRFNRAAAVLALLYAALHLFPQAVFAHNVTADGITFYSRQPLSAGIAPCAARVRALLRRSELTVPGRTERVFLCDSPWLYALFCPTATRAFASSVSLTDNVFVAAADVSNDVARSRAPVYNTRVLSAVVAHEITHGLIRHRLGWWRGNLLPAWVAEGYCDHVANSGSFPETTGRYLMAAGRSDPSPSFRYFEYRQAVRYLLDERNLSFDQLVARADEFPVVEAETRKFLRDHAGS